MKILVVNAGSSSMKYQLINMKTLEVEAKGNCEKIGEKLGEKTLNVTHKTQKGVFQSRVSLEFAADAVKEIIKLLTDKIVGVLKSIDEIDAIGHRIVQGAEIFSSSTLITDKVTKQIEDLTPLAPLHQPGHVAGIKGFKQVLPKKPMVAVFDTVFHRTMPDYAARYPIPEQAYKEWNIKRYGAHGTSHQFISEELAKLTGKKGKFVICHLGNGASISAVENGKCMDTSMGFTPLEGIMMGTRTGDIDPTVVQRIMEKTGKTVGQTIEYLNKQCGFLGVSEISNDMREVEKAYAETGNEKCKLAIKMFTYRIKKYIAAYAAALGGVDAIAFSAGIGENGSEAREQILDGLEFMGIVMDKNLNTNFKRGENFEITGKGSKVRIFVVPTNEEIMIARETQKVAFENKK